MGSIFRLLAWPLRKLAFAALLFALGFIGVGLWLFLHETDDFETGQRRSVHGLTEKNLQLKAALIEADRRMAATRTEIAARQLRADQAAKVVRDLDDLNSGFSRITTSSEQLKGDDQRVTRMKQMEIDSRKKAEELAQNLIHIQWEKDGAEIALERNQTELTATLAEDSPLLHYARQVWESYAGMILAGVLGLMLLPSLWRLWRFWRN